MSDVLISEFMDTEIAEGLIRDGKMKPGGLHQVTAARSDGRWEAAYASPATIEVPDDLKRALRRYPQAARQLDAISRTSRYSFLGWIENAVRPETRQRRIEQTIRMLLKGEVPAQSVRKSK